MEIYDMTRPEATVTYTVQQLSNLSGPQLLPPRYVRNLPWKIMLDYYTTTTTKKKYLSIFLKCNANEKYNDWSCHASVEFKLLTNQVGIKTVRHELTKVFCNADDNWGFQKFILWEDLMEPRNGFIRDDSIRLEVHWKADEPNINGSSWGGVKQRDNVDEENIRALKNKVDEMGEHIKVLKEEINGIKELIVDRNARENNREKVAALQQAKKNKDLRIQTVKRNTSSNDKETEEVEGMEACTEVEEVPVVQEEPEIIDLDVEIETEISVEEKNQKRNEVERGEGEDRINGVCLEYKKKDRCKLKRKNEEIWENKKEKEDGERKIIEQKRLKIRKEIEKEIEDRLTKLDILKNN